MSKSYYEDTLEKRNALLQKLKEEQPGGKIEVLSEKEVKVAKLLKEFKMEIINRAKPKDKNFPYIMTKKFAEYKEEAENSTIYKALKKFPKGGILHCHFLASVQSTWVVKNLCYKENCYMYVGESKTDENGKILTKGMFHVYPKMNPPNSNWKNVNELRKESGSAEKFDEEIIKSITMTAEDEEGTPGVRWIKFQVIFALIFDLVFYKENFCEYFREMCRVFNEGDSILYAELNSGLGVVYDENQKYLSPEEHLLLYIELNKESIKKYKDWVGVRIIHEDVKFVDSLKSSLETSYYLQNKYPSMCVGFDAVGEEDHGHTTFYYLKELCEFKEKAKKENKKIQYIFHAGESNWTNNNIVDCILLDTKRIGHATNLFRYHQLMDIIKKKDIALEISPVSNKVLGFVSDQRKHPVITYMNFQIPVTISNDDPGLLNYDGVTHDYYCTTMGFLVGTIKMLASLKTLSKNGIKYSSLSDEGKKKAYKIWDRKYEEFLDYVMNELK